jgi:hypothetical protein
MEGRMRELAEHAYFRLCLALGRALRAWRYSAVRIVEQGGGMEVRKRRRLYAPLLVWLGGPLGRVLDTGVRVLPQREWEERERRVWREVHGREVRVHDGGVLVLPFLPGRTLAALLEDAALAPAARHGAARLAARALADFHRAGFTHGDAMAENVMVELGGGVARWFDFETVHDDGRPLAWRRADDLRALLATCLIRTVPAERPETFGLLLDAYGERDPHGLQEATRPLAASFHSAWQRPLAFHLGQAGLSFGAFREVPSVVPPNSRNHRGAVGARRSRGGDEE